MAVRRTSSIEMRTPASPVGGAACRRAGGGDRELRFLQPSADRARAGDGRFRGDRQARRGAQDRQSSLRSPRTPRSPRRRPRRRRPRPPSRRRRPSRPRTRSPRPSRSPPPPVEKPKPEPPKPTEDVVALKPKEPEPPKVEKKIEPPKPEPPKPEVKKVEPPKPPPPKPRRAEEAGRRLAGRQHPEEQRQVAAEVKTPRASSPAAEGDHAPGLDGAQARRRRDGERDRGRALQDPAVLEPDAGARATSRS